MDDEFEWDHDDEIVDLDGCEATGDPRLDILGYESPKRRGQNLSGFTSSGGDWLARADEMRAQRQARLRQAKAEAQRQRAAKREPEQRPATVSHRAEVGTPDARPVPVEPTVAALPQSPQPGQHGAYFERRVTRRWWAPWTKRTTWTQVSAWTHGHVPTDVEVVTVADLSEVPGKVHTFGTVTPSGAVVW